MKAKVSTLVHFIDAADGEHHAALIVAISDEEMQAVNLVHWNPYGAMLHKDGAIFDAEAKKPNTWHFIEADKETAPEGQPNANPGTSSPGDSLPNADTGKSE